MTEIFEPRNPKSAAALDRKDFDDYDNDDMQSMSQRGRDATRAQLRRNEERFGR